MSDFDGNPSHVTNEFSFIAESLSDESSCDSCDTGLSSIFESSVASMILQEKHGPLVTESGCPRCRLECRLNRQFEMKLDSVKPISDLRTSELDYYQLVPCDERVSCSTSDTLEIV